MKKLQLFAAVAVAAALTACGSGDAETPPAEKATDTEVSGGENDGDKTVDESIETVVDEYNDAMEDAMEAYDDVMDDAMEVYGDAMEDYEGAMDAAKDMMNSAAEMMESLGDL